MNEGKLTPEDEAFTDSLANRAVTEPWLNERWNAFITQNPSMNPCPAPIIIKFLRRWMEYGDDANGLLSRAKLRREIRDAVPMRPENYVMMAAQIREVIEKHLPTAVDFEALVSKLYSACRYIEDPKIPSLPSVEMSRPVATEALWKLIYFLDQQASKPTEKNSGELVVTENVKSDPARLIPVDTRHAMAWASYRRAIEMQKSLRGAAVKKVWNWIKDNAIEIEGETYDLPTFETWSRYFREAKKELGDPSKNLSDLDSPRSALKRGDI